MRAVDKGECVFLILLDLSAAFDTVDHNTLLNRLKEQYGYGGDVLKWIKSYLTDRKQVIRAKGVESDIFELKYGVPQGSVLGPELFKDYIAPLYEIIKSYNVNPHGYADDTQIFKSFKPGKNEFEVLRNVENCIEGIRKWMGNSFLKLNDGKTQFIIIGSKRNLEKVVTKSVKIGSYSIQAVEQVNNIGAVFDKHMNMDAHLNATCKAAWLSLYNISKIRQYLTYEQSETVMHAFVTSRLDQNNSLLVNLPNNQLSRLQAIQNAAARIIKKRRKFDHVTPLLKELHWLPIVKRPIFKILLLVFKCLHGQGPQYLMDLLIPYVPTVNLRSSTDQLLCVPKSKLVTYGDRSFSVIAPTLWNDLPIDVKDCDTVPIFKRKLKTYLFTQAYS